MATESARDQQQMECTRSDCGSEITCTTRDNLRGLWSFSSAHQSWTLRPALNPGRDRVLSRFRNIAVAL